MTAEGKKVGRVVDLELARGPGYAVSAILTGTFGWLDRLHVIGPAARFLRRAPKPKSIPWADVEKFEGFVVTLKAGPVGDRPPDPWLSGSIGGPRLTGPEGVGGDPTL